MRNALTLGFFAFLLAAIIGGVESAVVWGAGTAAAVVILTMLGAGVLAGLRER